MSEPNDKQVEQPKAGKGLKMRAERLQKLLDAYNSSGFADADAAMEKYLDAINDKSRAEASLAEARAENELYCTHALVTLSGAGFITPAETYGANTSWVIGDLCRAVTAQHAELATLKAQEAPEKAWERGWKWGYADGRHPIGSYRPNPYIPPKESE